MTGKYIKLCKISELEELKGNRYHLDDEYEVAVFMIRGKVYVVDNVCPHNHTPKIADGYIKGNYVVCPVHLYQFDFKTGKPKNNVGGKLRIFETMIKDEYLYVKKPASKLFDFNF
ncbi:hypothetical protein D4R20_00935 [bacterium]|nr:MAG: hypothetical protein D4R20_00935 [bacterium]